MEFLAADHNLYSGNGTKGTIEFAPYCLTGSAFDQLAGVSYQFSHQRAQFGDGGLFNIQKPLVFGRIPFLVGVIQNAPLDGGPTQRVGQTLEYGVAVFAALAGVRAMASMRLASASLCIFG